MKKNVDRHGPRPSLNNRHLRSVRVKDRTMKFGWQTKNRL